MSEVLKFKQLVPGFLISRAECEFGYFRVWFEGETWWWSLNNDSLVYGPEETRDDAMLACVNYYETLFVKA